MFDEESGLPDLSMWHQVVPYTQTNQQLQSMSVRLRKDEVALGFASNMSKVILIISLDDLNE